MDSLPEIRITEDGYLYRDGRNTGKYRFKRNGWNNFWEPLVKQLNRVEVLHQKLLVRSEKHWDKVSELIEELSKVCPSGEGVDGAQSWMKNDVVFHAKPTHKYEEWQGKTWWLYSLGERDADQGGGKSWTFEWVKEPETKIQPELGQRFYVMVERHRPRWTGMIKDLLEEALIEEASKLEKPKHAGTGRTYHLIVNGRDYWLYGHKKYPDRKLNNGQIIEGYTEIRVVHWPDNPAVEHLVRSEGKYV